ncbi:Uncharacterised protein [Bordetella pertussis]|nr:Uncharacterised protein [Bordetella pertussis]CFW44758.1 Uncharacterised protein [Bordetella pertussis]
MTASLKNRAGVMRLKPKRPSRRNCRHRVKGRPSRPSNSGTQASSSNWRRKSCWVSCPSHRSMNCRPPSSVSATRMAAS